MSSDKKLSRDVLAVLSAYPPEAREYFAAIRFLIFSVASDYGIEDLSEVLKWGQPSYLCRKGSTVRVAWNSANPNSMSLYFHCQSRLVDTYRSLYGDSLHLIGKRELRLEMHKPIPSGQLRICIELALKYHDIKHLHLLGA